VRALGCTVPTKLDIAAASRENHVCQKMLRSETQLEQETNHTI
jgi:hypothetical protein